MIGENWIDVFAPAKGAPPRTLLAFYRWALAGAGPILVGAGLLSALAGVAEVMAALLLGWVIDAALAGEPGTVFADNAALFGFALVFFLALRPGVLGLSSYAQTILIQPNTMNLVLARLHRHTMGQAVGFFDEDFAGRIAQKETQTARALNDTVVEIIQTVLFALASVIGSILLLGTVDLRIAAGLLVWMIAYGLLIRYFMPKVRARSKARAAARAMVTGQVVDTVTNIKTVKLFAHEGFEDQGAINAMETYRQRFFDFGRVSVSFRFCLMALAGVLPVLLVGGALIYWQAGVISAGDIAATGAISLRLAQMTGWVSFTLMSLYANIGEVEDGIRTLTGPHSVTDPPDAPELAVDRAQIDFRGVSFAYGRGAGGLQNIDLTIAPGEKLGIVGASGAGKSTLVALLLRLYDTEDGAIEIDSQNVAAVTQDGLRRQISMVTQETAMFNRSARDNIAYGNPLARESDIVDAARQAGAHDFIQDLEDHAGRTGYDAYLGERGVKLSGGQRQRIALARAILKDAPILVLDEATSALDSEVEAQIQSALSRVMQGKTVIAIAHRLSTLTEMDRIIVLDAGRIVEEGDHATLLSRGGLYARYWQRQSGGFISTQAAE